MTGWGMQIKAFLRRKGWVLLALLFLTGCDILEGFGSGLGNAFKGIKIP